MKCRIFDAENNLTMMIEGPLEDIELNVPPGGRWEEMSLSEPLNPNIEPSEST